MASEAKLTSGWLDMPYGAERIRDLGLFTISANHDVVLSTVLDCRMSPGYGKPENGLHWSVWPILPVFPYPGDILQSRTVHESVELGPRPNANIAHKIFVV